jgi:hypothetical protein
MSKLRYSSTQALVIEECELCSQSHNFSLQVLYEEDMEVIGMYGYATQYEDVVLTCPTKNQPMVVSVPVELTTLQSLISVKPK